MNHKHRLLLRATWQFRKNLMAQTVTHPSAQLPEPLWAGIRGLSRKIERARERGWYGAIRRLTVTLHRELALCQGQLLMLSNKLDGQTRADLPAESEMFRDVLALEQEFPRVAADRKAGEIRVTTEAIVLDGIDLGPFDIRLQVDVSRGRPAYRVVALDACPAASNDGVTHPHVSGESLCEGDGHAAIQNALRKGRLYDFFLLVQQVLKTYARGQAYVELKNWRKVRCVDCGEMVDADDGCFCHACEDPLCAGCAATCRTCGRDFCAQLHSNLSLVRQKRM